MLMNQPLFHRETMTLIVNNEPMPAELLSRVRSSIPEAERYNLKFVVYPVNQGIGGQLDVAQLLDGLNQMAVVRNFGLSLAALQKTLQADWNRKGGVGQLFQEQPTQKPARKAKPRVLRANSTPSPKTKSRRAASSEEALPLVEVGTRISVTDPRRNMTGRILHSDQKLTKVMWDSGRKSVIDTKRLHLKRFYKIG